jgi:hypothetical protein
VSRFEKDPNMKAAVDIFSLPHRAVGCAGVTAIGHELLHMECMLVSGGIRETITQD